jgi:hypothetical protein
VEFLRISCAKIPQYSAVFHGIPQNTPELRENTTINLEEIPVHGNEFRKVIVITVFSVMCAIWGTPPPQNKIE